jgi:hypothetical protein
MSMRTKLCMLFIMIGLGFATQAHSQNYYEKAVGLRLGWGLGLTGKMFLNDKAAIEGIARYRGFGGFGVNWYWLSIQGLYLIHNPLEEVTPGLQWYYGGGAYVGFYGGDWNYPGSDFSSTFVGISGALGLDYKFEDIPLNVSVDWIPSFQIVGGTGFTGESGGLAARYTF